MQPVNGETNEAVKPGGDSSPSQCRALAVLDYFPLSAHTGPSVAPALGLIPPRAGGHRDRSEITPCAIQI
jgi:hypothetical protein